MAISTPSVKKGAHQFVSFVCIGGGLAAFGTLLMFGLVQFGVHPVMANAIQLIVTLGLNLELNRRITWRDSKYDMNVALRFTASRLVTLGLSWIGFALLQTHLNYVIANSVMLGIVTVANFVISDKLVFSATDREDEVTCATA